MKGTAVVQTLALPLPQWSGDRNNVPSTGPPPKLLAEPYGLAVDPSKTQTQ